MRGSIPIARVTSSTSAPRRSHRSASWFAYEIFSARNELLACLISSELLIVVTTKIGDGPGGHAPLCTGHVNLRSRIGR